MYDLMEPFRWLGDITTMQAFESNVLDMKDFHFTADDYRYRIEVEAKRRFLELLKDRFNSGCKYNGKRCKWDTVILGKTQELGRFLSSKTNSLDFVSPSPKLERRDSLALRKRIFELTQGEAKELGVGKSTLHCLRQKAGADHPFKVYHKIADRLR